MSFQISALPYQHFQALFNMTDEDLQNNRAVRITVEKTPGTPCRVSLQDAAIGEEVILTHYTHQQAESPFHASHAIYIRRNAVQAVPAINEVPQLLRSRLLSIRAFDNKGFMRNADVTPGTGLEAICEQMLTDPTVAYLHIHNAKFGCYLARVDRA